MGASKKQRGKQRKAAKQSAAANNEQVPVTPPPPPSDEFPMPYQNAQGEICMPMSRAAATATIDDLKLESIVSTRVALLVSNCDHEATTSLCSNEQCLTPIVKSGILSTVLNFLKRCEIRKFDHFVSSVAQCTRRLGIAISGGSGGGDLKSPLYWIAILRLAVKQEDECTSEIAQKIGPLVRCMCNDMERSFFQSNKHWREGIGEFVELVSDLIRKSINSTDETKKVVDTLLNHEGLLTSILQWGFYNDEHRPDIVKEIGIEVCTQILSSGTNTVANLIESAYRIRDGNRLLTGEGRGLLKAIGSTPIVNRDYDPTCKVSYVEGLIHVVKKEGWERNGSNVFSFLIPHLIAETDDCDKGVIKEMIDLGANYVHDYAGAELVTRLASRMICIEISEEKVQPNDTRTAFAIRAGLIEMCLSFIERFYRHGSIINDDELFYFTHRVFVIIHELFLHQKTAKAIRSKRRSIEEKLVSLEGDVHISSNPMCKELLDMVKSILRFSGSYCCRCNKSLSKTEVKQCNGCGTMVYCSKACQRDDWFNGGHKLACCKSFTNETAGQFQGRFLPSVVPDDNRDAKKMEDFDINMSMLQLKLFLDHSGLILTQAKALDIPLWDCVVRFDLRNYPPTMTILNYTDQFDKAETRIGFEKSRSKDNITCLYYSSIYIGDRKGYVRQRLFPHKWLNYMPK